MSDEVRNVLPTKGYSLKTALVLNDAFHILISKEIRVRVVSAFVTNQSMNGS